MHSTSFDQSPAGDELVERALSGSVLRPFWLDHIQAAARFNPVQGDLQTDLLVVGGGYLGLWTSILAKERNARRRVVLLEGRHVGWAASGRNGGFCEASITHGQQNGKQRWPDEFEELERLGHENFAEFEQDIKRYGIDCDFERTGRLEVATEPHQVPWLQGEGFLSKEEVRAQIASPSYLAGRWSQGDGALLHPAKLAFELARVATELGVEIFENSEVLTLRSIQGGVQARTAHGVVVADTAVIATNAFRSLLKRYALHTIPVYDYSLMTEPLTDEDMQSIGWKRRQGVSDLGNQFHYYRLSRDNRILFGGFDAIYHFGGQVSPSFEDRMPSHRRLAHHFFTTFPQLIHRRFTHRWAGAIDASTRFCAFFGRALGGRALYCAGFTGLGVSATRFAANVLLDMIEGRSTPRTQVRMVSEMPVPFPPEPFTYVAVQATRWALDRADHNEGKRNLLLRIQDALGLGFDS